MNQNKFLLFFIFVAVPQVACIAQAFEIQKERKMVMTVLEAHVPMDRIKDVERVFHEGMAEIPPSIVESYLVQDTKDLTLFRLNTVWRSMEDLQKMRSSGVKPKGVQLFEAVGSKPELKIFNVIVHKSH